MNLNIIFISYIICIFIIYNIIHNNIKCNYRIPKTYLILTISIIYLFFLINNLTNYTYIIEHNFIILFIISIIVIFIILFSPHNSLLQIIVFVLLIILIALYIQPIYHIANIKGTIKPILATVICIFISLTLITFIYPNFINLNWTKYILIGLFSLICFRLMLLVFNNNNISLIKLSSYLGILLFSFIILYDTKYILIKSKECSKPYYYINHILSLFLDFINIFTDMLNINILNN